MKLLILITLLFLASCGTTRVLVKDCESAGVYENCELVTEI